MDSIVHDSLNEILALVPQSWPICAQVCRAWHTQITKLRLVVPRQHYLEQTVDSCKSPDELFYQRIADFYNNGLISNTKLPNVTWLSITRIVANFRLNTYFTAKELTKMGHLGTACALIDYSQNNTTQFWPFGSQDILHAIKYGKLQSGGPEIKTFCEWALEPAHHCYLTTYGDKMNKVFAHSQDLDIIAKYTTFMFGKTFKTCLRYIDDGYLGKIAIKYKNKILLRRVCGSYNWTCLLDKYLVKYGNVAFIKWCLEEFGIAFYNRISTTIPFDQIDLYNTPGIFVRQTQFEIDTEDEQMIEWALNAVSQPNTSFYRPRVIFVAPRSLKLINKFFVHINCIKKLHSADEYLRLLDIKNSPPLKGLIKGAVRQGFVDVVLKILETNAATIWRDILKHAIKNDNDAIITLVKTEAAKRQKMVPKLDACDVHILSRPEYYLSDMARQIILKYIGHFDLFADRQIKIKKCSAALVKYLCEIKIICGVYHPILYIEQLCGDYEYNSRIKQIIEILLATSKVDYLQVSCIATMPELLHWYVNKHYDCIDTFISKTNVPTNIGIYYKYLAPLYAAARQSNIVQIAENVDPELVAENFTLQYFMRDDRLRQRS
jgi:hypothetical protein